MKCPYCFKVTRFRTQKKKGTRIVNYCILCRLEVPRTYMESPEIEYTKIGMIGYSGHGKTTYLISLLSQLKELTGFDNEFHIETLDDKSYALMYSGTKRLEKGYFPKSTKAVFPRPVFMSLN